MRQGAQETLERGGAAGGALGLVRPPPPLSLAMTTRVTP